MTAKKFRRIASKIQLANFSILPGEWELNWVGGLAPVPNAVGRYTVNVEMRSQVERPRMVAVPVNAAGALGIGSVWRDGRLVGQYGDERRFHLAIPEAASLEWRHPLPTHGQLPGLPKSIRPIYSGTSAGSLSVYPTLEGTLLLVPDWAVFAPFYAFTPSTAVAAFFPRDFTGPAASVAPHDPSRTGWIKDTNTFQICRKHHVDENTAIRFARTIATESGGDVRKRLFNWTLRNAQQKGSQHSLPQVLPPFEGECEWKVVGQAIADWYGNRAFLVYQLKACIAPMPFDCVAIDAWNDSSKGKTLVPRPKPAFPGARSKPRAGTGASPPWLGSGLEDPTIQRQEFTAAGMQDVNASKVPRVKPVKDVQTHKSAGYVRTIDPPERATSNILVHGQTGQPGVSFATPDPPQISSEPLSPEERNNDTARAYDQLIGSTSDRKDVVVRWYPKPHEACSLLPSHEKGRRTSLYFLVLRVEARNTTTYVIDYCRRRVNDAMALAVLRRTDRTSLTDTQLSTVLEYFYSARKLKRSWTKEIPRNDYVAKKVIHAAETVETRASVLCERISDALASIGAIPPEREGVSGSGQGAPNT
jgi:hypothetical protein